MLIDGHAHACGYYQNTKDILRYLKTYHIDKVALCPGEADSVAVYNLPLFSSLFKSENLGFGFNRIIRFAVGLKGAAKRIDEQNVIVGQMAGQYPDRIVQAYWVNPLDDECIEKMAENYDRFHFKLVKLHQCWHRFDVASKNVRKIAEWAAERRLPAFIHRLPSADPRVGRALRRGESSNKFETFQSAKYIGRRNKRY